MLPFWACSRVGGGQSRRRAADRNAGLRRRPSSSLHLGEYRARITGIQGPGLWRLDALQQPGVDLVQMVHSQRQMPVVVCEPGFDSRDGPREPFTVCERDKAVKAAMER
jgi:hypothetical protein